MIISHLLFFFLSFGSSEFHSSPYCKQLLAPPFGSKIEFIYQKIDPLLLKIPIDLMILRPKNQDLMLDAILKTLMFTNPNAGTSRAKRIIRLILSDPEEYLVAKNVAKHFGLSSRTLFRRLEEEGITFMSMARTTQLLGARHTILHIAGTDVRLLDVSLYWGYANPSKLNRAYAAFFNELPRVTRDYYTPKKKAGNRE